jgi:alpha-L-fucosidase
MNSLDQIKSDLKQVQIPEWFQDQKFGIFSHWGLYSVPEIFPEWYARYLYHTDESLLREEPFLMDGKYPKLTEEKMRKRRLISENTKRDHERRYGHPSTFGYKDLIQHFDAPAFDPNSWLDAIAASGAKYFIPVAEHHDGFAMYQSKLNRWNVKDMGPKRDVMMELKEATKQRGLKFGVSSHRAWKWRYYNFDPQQGYDNTNPEYADFYGPAHSYDTPPSQDFVEEWYRHTVEMIDHIDPDLLYFDFGWHDPAFGKKKYELAHYYYSKHATKSYGEHHVLCDKGALPDGMSLREIERGSISDISKTPWQCDTSMSYTSWGYMLNDAYKTPARIIYEMADVVSKNGNYLLNITPRADGSLPDVIVSNLHSIGRWMDINGEAIYSTRPWEVWGENSPLNENSSYGNYHESEEQSFDDRDIRFTCKGNIVYAIVLGWPGLCAKIKSLRAQDIVSASMLGHCESLTFRQTDEHLEVSLPRHRPCDHAFVLKFVTKS